MHSISANDKHTWPKTSASPGDLLECKSFWVRNTGLRPCNVCFNKPCGGFSRTFTFENCHLRSGWEVTSYMPCETKWGKILQDAWLKYTPEAFVPLSRIQTFKNLLPCHCDKPRSHFMGLWFFPDTGLAPSHCLPCPTIHLEVSWSHYRKLQTNLKSFSTCSPLRGLPTQVADPF